MVIRLAIIADVHGNFRALQAVLADLANRRVDRVISLGDNIGYGPEPDEVVRRLSTENIYSVMGNHELALVSPSYYSRLNPSSRTSLDITRSLLTPESLDWLATLDPVAIDHGARFVHGCPPASISCYLFRPSSTRLSRIFLGFPEFIGFCGHTHTLELFTLMESGRIEKSHPDIGTIHLLQENRYLIIPGSVGQPRDNLNNRAKYAILDREAGIVEFHAVKYDVESTVKLLHERGFPLHNAQRLVW